MRKVYTAPAVEPLSLTEAKLYLKVDHTDEDTLITALVKAAREVAEHYTRRSFITTVWDASFDDFPSGSIDYFQLYGGPVASITSITYYNSAGTLVTLSSSVYLLDTGSDRVSLALNQSWPATDERLGGVVIRYSAGYGSTSASVPETIRTAMLLILGHLYENRQDVVTGTVSRLPLGAEYLLDKYRAY
jgi:uncharacterized phiE125 gp8 family phage protein